MKIRSHTKKQLIASAVMVVIFFITVLYSKGYFDFTFIDRPSGENEPVATQRQEQTYRPEETAYPDDYFGEQFGEIFEEEFGNMEDMEYTDEFIPQEFNFNQE